MKNPIGVFIHIRRLRDMSLLHIKDGKDDSLLILLNGILDPANSM